MAKAIRQWMYRERTPIDLNEVRFGATRWTWVRIAYLVMSAGIVLGFYFQADAAASREREACERGNDTRAVISEVIQLVGDPSATDLTVIPGFADLDAETRQFLINLRDETARAAEEADASNETFKDLAAIVLLPREC